MWYIYLHLYFSQHLFIQHHQTNIAVFGPSFPSIYNFNGIANFQFPSVLRWRCSIFLCPDFGLRGHQISFFWSLTGLHAVMLAVDKHFHKTNSAFLTVWLPELHMAVEKENSPCICTARGLYLKKLWALVGAVNNQQWAHSVQNGASPVLGLNETREERTGWVGHVHWWLERKEMEKRKRKKD